MTKEQYGAEAPDRATLEQYRAQARTWLENNLERRTRGEVPDRSPWDASDDDVDHLAAQRALQRQLYDAGYAGIGWPREYGGQGLHPAYDRAFQEEARAFVLPHLGIAGGATYGVCAPTMLAHASHAFLTAHIPRILAGDEIVAQFFSDPDAGSDLAGVRTQAVRDGDRWILNGSKIWSSGAYYADAGMCLARTNWDVPKHRGLTWFLVPTRAPGVTVERIRQINGNSEFCQEFFTDVELSDDDVIGEVNDGWTVTQTMLLYERGGSTSQDSGPPPRRAGIRRDVLELAAAVDGLDDPAVRDLVAQIHVDDLARLALGQRLAALMAADPLRAANLASYAKLASGVFDPIRANRALRIAGDRAVAWDDDDGAGAGAALGLLNSRFLAIAGGTSQMQRNVIGERVLGLPREPSFDSRKPFRDVVRDARGWSGWVS
jgi:alkylation response protein AidB-like acyl-CoA dehydrogenase